MATENLRDNAFLPTTQIYDVEDLRDMDVNSPEFKELLVRLYMYTSNSASAINSREVGLYYPIEVLTGGTFFPDSGLTGERAVEGRSIFRQVIDFGALPNAGAKTVAHNIAGAASMKLVRMYGGATDPATPSFLPLPFASTTLNQNIQLEAGTTNVTITTGINRTAYTDTFVVMEYLKQ
jgi:hypothetical protein